MPVSKEPMVSAVSYTFLRSLRAAIISSTVNKMMAGTAYTIISGELRFNSSISSMRIGGAPKKSFNNNIGNIQARTKEQMLYLLLFNDKF